MRSASSGAGNRSGTRRIRAATLARSSTEKNWITRADLVFICQGGLGVVQESGPVRGGYDFEFAPAASTNDMLDLGLNTIGIGGHGLASRCSRGSRSQASPTDSGSSSLSQKSAVPASLASMRLTPLTIWPGQGRIRLPLVGRSLDQ